jgi:putative tricarboxylic transport membrane protein
MMAALGLLIAAIGIDMVTGERRLTFGSLELSSGIDIIPLAVGLLGLREILFLAEKKIKGSGALGKIDGIQLGGGGSLSSIADYGLQKEFSKNPEMFGKGAIDGLAATETADNASSNSAFIPLLTLGLPPNSVLTLLFGVLMLHNVTPGPTMIEDHPNVFWGVIASMYIGNALLLLFNLPAIGAFVQILRIPAGLMFPFVVVIAFCGVYSANNQLFDVFVAAVFGII